MRFDIRTLMRTISALGLAALLLAATMVPALAQGRGRGRGRGDDRRHHGWTRGQHRGWSHSARRGRMWRNDNNNNRRWRRRAVRRDRREARRDWRRNVRRNRVSYYGTRVPYGSTYRRVNY